MLITYLTPLASWPEYECDCGLEGWDLSGLVSGGLCDRSEPGLVDGGGGADVQKVAKFAPSFLSFEAEYGGPKWTVRVPGPIPSAVGPWCALFSTN